MFLSAFLSEVIKVVRGKAYQSANTGDVNGDGFDMEADGGYDGVLIVAIYGTAASNNLLLAEQSSDNGGSDNYSEIADSEVAAGGGSNEIQFVDIKRPRKRYIRGVAQRGTSSTVEQIIYLGYRTRNVPVDNETDGTIAGVRLNHPDEGAA